MINKYKCNLCGKVVSRESNKKWIKTICDETYKTTRMYKIKAMIKNEEERKVAAKRAEELMDKEMLNKLTLEEAKELKELLYQVDKFEDDNYKFD